MKVKILMHSNLRKPHEITETFGTLTTTIGLKYPEKFPKTCSAMAKVAQAVVRADKARIDGHDDYTISLETLMNAFDVFVRENTEKYAGTGNFGNFDTTIPCELTLLLLWNIRHTWTHNGGYIDEKCKSSYETILSQAKDVEPISCLPKKLEVDYEFSINYSDYCSVKKCFFHYIESRIDEEDYKILLKRSSIADIRLNKCGACMPFENGHIWFDVAEAHQYGVYIDTKTGIVESPKGTEYCIETERIVLPDGNSFPVKFVLRANINVPNNRVSLKKLFEITSRKVN